MKTCWDIGTSARLHRKIETLAKHVIDNCEKADDLMISQLTLSVCRVAALSRQFLSIAFVLHQDRICRLALVYYTDIGYLNGKLRYGYRSVVDTDGSRFACLSVANRRSVLARLKNVAFTTDEKNKRTPTNGIPRCASFQY